jgi:hypothetical protein
MMIVIIGTSHFEKKDAQYDNNESISQDSHQWFWALDTLERYHK